MSLDLHVLQLLKYRDKFEALRRAIPTRVLDARTHTLLNDFERFFREYPDAPMVDRQGFWLFFKMVHPKLGDDDLRVYFNLLKEVNQDLDKPLEQGLMKRLLEAATAHDLALTLARYQAGEEVDLREEVTAFMEGYEAMASKNLKNPQVLDPIEDLLKADADDTGLKWRWDCLNKAMRPVRGGDFIILAGRPDKGKTTALADNLTYMASQVDTVYPGENRSILWFNNEGPGKRIVTRNFQSALNVTIEELAVLAETPADPQYAHWKSMARQQYALALGGRPGVLRVFDIHDYTSNEVEDIIKRYNPALLVFDMVDNIRFSGGAVNGGERTDQLLEEMYKWARNRGVKYDCGVIATSQVSADGDGMPYPTLPMLKDSKTGKQGAADAIITIGASNDAALANIRFIGTTKNKLRRTGAPSSPRAEMVMDGARGRYNG